MEIKKCRKCKQELELENFNPDRLWKYWVSSTCKTCKASNIPKYNKPSIRSQKNSNNQAKFTNEVKEQIYERDGFKCIICECFQNFAFDVHHIYFWTESEYWEDRNDVNKWVLLCRLCHAKAHSCSKWEWVRQECINYITNNLWT